MSRKTGPGNPPVATRFRKGQSGNPKGRPKGTKAKTSGSAFDVVIDKTLSVTRSGVQRQLTIEEALQHKTLHKALAGDRAARREVLRMIEKREKALAKSNGTGERSVEIRVDRVDANNVNEALLVLGAARPDTKWADRDMANRLLRLELWAVQAALDRRRGGSRLSDADIKGIKDHTRDQERLHWPRGTRT